MFWAIYDLIISNTSQPVVHHHRQRKKKNMGRTHPHPDFWFKKSRRLHQPKAFCLPSPPTECLVGIALPFAWGDGAAPFPQACSRRTCQSISLTRARPLRCHSSSRAIGYLIIISTKNNGGCLPLGCLDEISYRAFRSFCYVLCGYQFFQCLRNHMMSKMVFPKIVVSRSPSNYCACIKKNICTHSNLEKFNKSNLSSIDITIQPPLLKHCLSGSRASGHTALEPGRKSDLGGEGSS